jgi:hypothetical protein
VIDVLIPCRNGGDTHLAQLIHSIERQNVDVNIDIEFNSGERLCDVRNRLLARNNGDLVYFVDADDYLPNRSALSRLVEACTLDYAWGDFEAHITPRDKWITVHQQHMRKIACGSWLAKRSSFSADPWQPLSKTQPHRSDWFMPEEWKGTHVEFPIFTYRVAWSSGQLTTDILES